MWKIQWRYQIKTDLEAYSGVSRKGKVLLVPGDEVILDGILSIGWNTRVMVTMKKPVDGRDVKRSHSGSYGCYFDLKNAELDQIPVELQTLLEEMEPRPYP